METPSQMPGERLVVAPSEPETGHGPAPGSPVRRMTPAQRAIGRLRRILVQAAVVALVVLAVAAFVFAIRHTLAKQGIGFGFDYLGRASNINLSEGLGLRLDGWATWFEPLDSTSSNAEMLLAGLFNTLKVAVTAIVTSTIIGVAIGVGRLSTNWLIRKLCFAVVEFVRNTPLLVQLVFWYFAVVLQFPPITAASAAYGSLLVSQAGIYLPALAVADGASSLSMGMLLAASTLFLLASMFRTLGRVGRLTCLGFAVAAIGTSVWLGFPLVLDAPTVGRFGASGGVGLSPEMAALLLAITFNSAAYTAEIVRGAIEALAKGQWEASSALGMSRRDALRDIVLPQVFRVVLPSLGNRYISLTKDTSLGIAIGYPDLFNVSGTVANQTGRNLEGVVIVMVAYLLLSWVISGGINLLNLRLNGGQR